VNKKLLLVNKSFAPQVGGVETVVLQYANFAVQAGFDVTVLVIQPKFSLHTKVECFGNIKVIRASGFGIFLSMPISLSFFHLLWSESRKADIIHGHYPFPLFDIASILIPKTKKIILTWHSEILRQKYIKKLFYLFTNYLLSRATVTVTSDALKHMSPFLTKNKSNKILTLPLSVDSSTMDVVDSYSEITDVFGRQIPSKSALFIGRLCYYKGIDFLLNTLDVNDSLRVIPIVISGEGELLCKILHFVKQKKMDNVYVLGRFVSDKEKAYLLSHCHFLLFPSVLETEAFGIVQLEAMAQGKPVINTNLRSGVPWVSINNVTGFTVSVGDTTSLANSILTMFLDDNIYLKFSENARNRVKSNFLDSVVAEKYIDILNFRD
jgi:glycosyltransferase involved in cell wall biosynthesis